jgi:hypothetical protein
MTKCCNKCGLEKPLLEFRICAVRGTDYVRGGCRECERKARAAQYAANPEKAAAAARKWSREHPEKRNATKRRWRQNNPDKHKNAVLKRTYGISLEQYNQILAAQGEVCGICMSATVSNCGRRLSVDHNHETGKVRGLLCGRCNSMLGFIDEHPGTLERAAAWIKK